MFPGASVHARDDPRAPREPRQILTVVGPRVARPASGRRIARRTRAFRWWLTRFHASSVLVVVTLLIGCGGAAGTSSTPVSPTDAPQISGVCRNYASSVTATTTTTITGQTPNGATEDTTTSYNIATNLFSATGTGMFNHGLCRRSVSWSTTYASLAEFIDEVSMIPPKTRWASQSGMVTFSGPSPCGNTTSAPTTTNSYDGQGRIVSSVSAGELGLSSTGSIGQTNPNITIPRGTAVYTAWDVLGRPTAYRVAGPSPVSGSISYDDSARTRSTNFYNGGFSTTTAVDAFDSDGNPVRSQRVTRFARRPLSPGPELLETSDTTFVIHATTRVCR